MKPNKKKQIVRFHTPFPDENPNMLYVVTDIHLDADPPRADIRAINSGLSVVPVNTVLIDDLELVDINTVDLMGHTVSVMKCNYSGAKGKVVDVSKSTISVSLGNGISGTETTTYITVQDEYGKEHFGTLLF